MSGRQVPAAMLKKRAMPKKRDLHAFFIRLKPSENISVFNV
jgi:hypothetical protein